MERIWGGHWRNICMIFWEGFWREYRPLYFICWDQLANKHFETNLKFILNLERVWENFKIWIFGVLHFLHLAGLESILLLLINLHNIAHTHVTHPIYWRITHYFRKEDLLNKLGYPNSKHLWLSILY